ncbi:hypothetical protein L2U69_14925 [Zavarzinia compransoris]|uniref:hypothetical protein n=1 Tax=Zavarzinia marina TaxID=2911065 RepID=UPI001F2621B4|nr:hypothetical protein [Zavarzinia marina]MCF4166944.1 hypothetical protein [Zavarzinia marina]
MGLIATIIVGAVLLLVFVNLARGGGKRGKKAGSETLPGAHSYRPPGPGGMNFP